MVSYRIYIYIFERKKRPFQIVFLVEVVGFEPTAFWSRTKCSENGGEWGKARKYKGLQGVLGVGDGGENEGLTHSLTHSYFYYSSASGREKPGVAQA